MEEYWPHEFESGRGSTRAQLDLAATLVRHVHAVQHSFIRFAWGIEVFLAPFPVFSPILRSKKKYI